MADEKLRIANAIREELRKGVLPTPEPVVRALIWRVDRYKLMRDHVYAKENKLRIGLDALISAALAAHLDLSRADAALTAYAQTRDRFEDHVRQTVENPAQKEVLAFCNAYVGTIDTLRRFRNRRADIWPQIEEVRSANTGDIAYRFIYELRKNLSHGSVVVPYWNVSSDASGTTGSIHFSASELLTFGDWGSDVRAFLQNQPHDSFSIAAITAQCAEGLAKFRRELDILFARNRTLAERDFHAINDLARRVGGRGLNRQILQNVVAQGVDPYAHLHRFFSPEETRRILEYPPNSAEQVEYIIRLREAEAGIDEPTRAVLYQLFKVPETIEAKPEPPSLNPKPLGDLWPPAGFPIASEDLPSAPTVPAGHEPVEK